MEFFVNIFLLLSGFVGAIVAVGGDTWIKNEPNFLKRITTMGWIAIFCLFLTFTLGVSKEYMADSDAKRLKEERAKLQERLLRVTDDLSKANKTLADTRLELNQATHEVGQASIKLTESKQKIASLEPNVIDAMYKLTEGITRESDFAFPKLIGQHTEYPISSRTDKPLLVYGGDEFEYHLLCSQHRQNIPFLANQVHAPLQLEVGSRRYQLSGNQGVIRVAGPIGQAVPAIITNAENYAGCDVKIVVKSTDKMRIETQFKQLLNRVKETKAALGQKQM